MIPKKEFFKLKIAIVLGYNGLQFHGMQKNPGVKTIEETIEKALFDSELILDHNYESLQKIGWSRAARTDKGVHAVANFVNCKLAFTSNFLLKDEENAEAPGEIPAEVEKAETGDHEVSKLKDKERIDWAKLVNVINSNLPDSIRVLTTKRITKVFDVKLSARSRIYEYLGPISMFVKDPKNITEEVEQKTLERLRVLVQKFKGTHNFHNYTSKMRASDPKAMRYIMEFDVEIKDFGEQGRFFQFRIRGQSFIYHQIRKMIGIMVQVIQEDLKDAFIDNSFFQNSVNIWLAPPQGLFLDRVTFDAYNKKNDIPEKLEFTQEEEEKLIDFKQNVLYPVIVEAEAKNKTFTEWLETTKTLQAQGKTQLIDESSGEEDDDDGTGKPKGGKKGGKRGKN